MCASLRRAGFPSFRIGRTSDNVHSAGAFRAWAAETYGGTRLGRQELDGELFEEVESPLWTRDLIEASRRRGAPPRWTRPVVGVDPPAMSELVRPRAEPRIRAL